MSSSLPSNSPSIVKTVVEDKAQATKEWISAPDATQPVLSSYEEVTKLTDTSRLPSYRPARGVRYHPYARRVPHLVDATGIDRLYNTIYDEEMVPLIPPPRLPGGPRPERPLVPSPLLRDGDDLNGIALELANGQYENVEEFNRRAQNVAAVVLAEFLAGLRRAQEA